MYYGLIIISVVMFGACFAIKDVYRKLRGASGLKMTFETLFVGSLGGLLVLAVANCLSLDNGIRFDIGGINPGFTVFTFVMAMLAAANSFGFTYCSFKALGSINLSTFSLFSMLGGMVLPFVQGILFYNEKITVAKIVCVVFICVALAMTLDFDKSSTAEKKKGSGTIYYVGIFVLNGMSGVLSKIFSSSTLPKTSAAGYSIWLALINAVVSGALLFTVFRKKGENEPPYTLKAGVLSGASGALNKITNFLLVIALAHVDASVQYPMVTGGVMIVSTLACYLTDRKPSKRELVSICLAFIGTLALFVIPI